MQWALSIVQILNPEFRTLNLEVVGVHKGQEILPVQLRRESPSILLA